MTTSRVESLPTTWDDARDIPFFRITARLFTPGFCFGASVLLASHDDDTADTQHTGPQAAETPAQTERELVPVRVRRTR
jgi:hypothetical protein